MMNIELSASVLSSLFFEHAASSCDLDGFLLGTVRQKQVDTINDAQINNVKQEIICYVNGFIPCREPFVWYNAVGKIVVEELKDVLSDGRSKDVVGWFRFRSNSSVRTSVREQRIHVNLLDCFPKMLPKHFLFMLCCPQQTANKSTHTMDHIFQVYCDRRFESLPVTVINLGDSVSDYKKQGTSTTNNKSGKFARTMNKYAGAFVDKKGKSATVLTVQSMNTELHQHLQDLCGSVMNTEEQLEQLRLEVRQLQQQLQPKPKVISSLPAARSTLADHTGTFGMHSPSSKKRNLEPTNPFYSALSKQDSARDAPPPYAELDIAELDLISWTDSEENLPNLIVETEPKAKKDAPSTHLDMDASFEIFDAKNVDQDSANYRNRPQDKDKSFCFVSDIIKERSWNSTKSEGSGKNLSTANVSSTKTRPDPNIEAIEYSSDEDQSLLCSNSPVF